MKVNKGRLLLKAAAVLSMLLLIAGIGMKNEMLGGIAVATLGIVTMTGTAVMQREDITWGICIGAVICATGMAIILAAFLRYFVWFDEVLEFGIGSLGIGMILFLMLLFDVHKIIVCREPVQTQFVRCVWHYGGKGPDTYSATYRVSWQGRQYEATSNLRYSKRKMSRMVTGEWYSVYINPHNPQMVREHRHISVSDIVLFVAGSLMFWFGIASILHCLQ